MISRLLALVVAIMLGAAVALQARINGELGRRLDDGYLAAWLSIITGLVMLCVPALGSRGGRAGLRRLGSALVGGTYPKWYFIGGLCGALMLIAQGLTAALLGVAIFTVAVVAGQNASGLLIDRRGIGTMAPRPVTWPRVLSTVLMVVAVLLAVSGQFRLTGSLLWLLLPLVAGVVIPFQQAINGQVREITASPLMATWNNFTLATVVLGVICLGHGLITGWPAALPTEWWLYLGGPLGVAYIAGMAMLVRRTGVLLLGLCTIAGQLLGSLVLDLVVPAQGQVLAWTTVAGIALALVAIATIAIPIDGARSLTR